MHIHRGAGTRQTNQKRRRRLLGAAAAVALPLAIAVGPPPASAERVYTEQIVGSGAAPSAYTTNIPYVAWRGEQIRAVKCDDALADADDGDVLIEEWSGSPGSTPQIESSTTTFFEGSDGTPCAAFDAVTLGDGLARVKLVVTNEDRVPILKHQFLMIWLTIGDVSIDEVGAADPTGGPAGSRNEVGDPMGDGDFDAADRNGRVQVIVDGTFPHELAADGRFTLPDDWATLAGALASDSSPVADPMRWDIHDDGEKSERHVGGWCAFTNNALDAVDNCLTPAGANENGPFSNAWGQGVQAAGPFDPARPATLLSDGVLNAGDAPMPALRVDVRIAPNSGARGDISGVGALEAADKSTVYSRNGNGTVAPHNLYAPYNQQFIPATSAPVPEASGVDGPAQGNNFPGFLVEGLYDNWAIADVLDEAPYTETRCNRMIDFEDEGPVYENDEPRLQPWGDQEVVVYTDEHGEAQVEYAPYAGGFYYDQLNTQINANRGCDLQDIDVLGTSQINATARYPYQPVSAPTVTSDTLTKTVGNLFDKSLSYYPKGSGSANGNARILIAHANDVDGVPFANERVCFNVGDLADGARPYTGWTGPANAQIHVGGTTADPIGGAICRYTDANGNAAIEVFNSDPELVNVVVEYIDEGLLRSMDLDFRTPDTTAGTPPPVHVDTTGGTPPPVNVDPAGGTPPPVAGSQGPPAQNGKGPAVGAGSNTPTIQQAVQAGVPQQQAQAAVTKVAKTKKLLVARVKKTKSGARALYVHVSSPDKTAKIKIKAGKKKAKVKTIKTNRLVRVTGVSIGKGKVKVDLA